MSSQGVGARPGRKEEDPLLPGRGQFGADIWLPTLKARNSDAALVHEHWPDNVFLETFLDIDIAKAFDAPIRVSREIRTARQCMAPIEGRGVVAFWDTRLEQLTVYSACQMPHIVRTGLSECLGLEEGQVRIIAPDVGGGFGYKGILLPEEICLGWPATRCPPPAPWGP